MFSSTVRASLFVLASAVAASAAPGLSLKFAGPASFTDSAVSVDALKLTAVITNTGSETLKLLNDPHTPLSTAAAETFHVTNAEGQSPAFKGVKVKYSASAIAKLDGAEHFTFLAPGASIEVVHDLTEAYNFESSGPGAYDFEPTTLFQYVDASGKVVPLYADVEVPTVRLAGSLNKVAASAPASIEKRISFVGCTAARQTILTTAAANAQSYASSAVSYINSHTTTSTRYASWFGAFTAARRSTVLSHFNAINSNAFSSYTYDCSTCTMSAYAYVYPDQFGKIYLCNAFWSAGATGTDSRAGTLVHESSHFTRVAGTDDVVYGQSGARALAKSNPTSAINNADSHEYFAENSPSEA